MSTYCQGRECPDCLGTGEIHSHGISRQCPTCHGVKLAPCPLNRVMIELETLIAMMRHKRDPMLTLAFVLIAAAGAMIALLAYLFVHH